jgi:hypothetical protein
VFVAISLRMAVLVIFVLMPGAFFTGAAAAFFAGAFLAAAFFTGAFFTGAFLAAAFLAGAFFAGAFFAGAFFCVAILLVLYLKVKQRNSTHCSMAGIAIERGVLPRSCLSVPSSYQQKVSRPMSHSFPQRQPISKP